MYFKLNGKIAQRKNTFAISHNRLIHTQITDII